MSDTTPIPPASEREREAFEDAYLADSRDPSMAEDLRHFLTGYRAALSHPSTPQGWISVLDELPPDREMVAVGWLDVEDHDHADRYSIDYLEEGVWQFYFSEHEHYLIAGVAKGRSEDAPYTHWQRIGAIPAPPEQGGKG